MRIVVTSGRFHLRLRFPLSFFKSRLFAKMIAKNVAEHAKSDFVLTREMAKNAYRILKDQVKRHGHFNLVEIDSGDGDKVIVRI